MKNFKNEHDFARWWKNLVESRGAYVIPLVASAMQQAGLPDRYLVHSLLDGGVWIENKFKNGKVRKLQAVTIRKMCEQGQPAFVLRAKPADEGLDGWELVAETHNGSPIHRMWTFEIQRAASPAMSFLEFISECSELSIE